MNIRFYNARVLTMEDPIRVLEDAQVWVENSTIIFVGRQEDVETFFQKEYLKPILWDREIDCEKNLLMPGFKNAHTHSAMTLMRSYADDLALNDWLYQKIFPMEKRWLEIDPKTIHLFTKLAILEYLSSGTTAVFDMYFCQEESHRAFYEYGMRCVLVGGINDFSGSVSELEKNYHAFHHRDELTSYCLGFHAEYTCSRKLLEELAELANSLRAPVFSHNSETQKEVAECIHRYQKTPTMLMDELQLFEYGGGGYHCVHFSKEDMELFANKKLSVITNPGSNTKLASGIAPISEFLKHGINIGIGTDGAASNNALDMFREMYLTAGLSKLREEDPVGVDAVDVLKMATLGGSIAMGLNQSQTLSKGQVADIIMIDLNTPNMQPIHNIPKNIVYSGSKQNVKMTMIHGRILYENGQYFVGEDVHDLYKEINEWKDFFIRSL